MKFWSIQTKRNTKIRQFVLNHLNMYYIYDLARTDIYTDIKIFQISVIVLGF